MDGWERLWRFIRFIFLSIITLGLYSFYFWVTRIEEQSKLLTEIRDELKNKDK